MLVCVSCRPCVVTLPHPCTPTVFSTSHHKPAGGIEVKQPTILGGIVTVGYVLAAVLLAWVLLTQPNVTATRSLVPLSTLQDGTGRFTTSGGLELRLALQPNAVVADTCEEAVEIVDLEGFVDVAGQAGATVTKATL